MIQMSSLAPALLPSKLMHMHDPSHEITLLLQQSQQEDQAVSDRLLMLVYDELRAIARSKMRRRDPDQTLQPTALVHEAYLRIFKKEIEFKNRRQFFFVASRAMRDILVERARKKAALKRGARAEHICSDHIELAIDTPAEDMLALNQALDQFEIKYPRKYQLVMLRFFSGLTTREAADILGTTVRTAERDWQFAKAHLYNVLAVN